MEKRQPKVKDVEYLNRLKARKKRALSKDLLFNLVLLILPTFLLVGLILVAPATYLISLFLIYFILPMFYTVDKRLRYAINGIGNPNFTYKDGYRDFFTSTKGGLFGVISTIFSAIVLLLLFYLIFSFTLDPIVNCFSDASELVNEVNNHLSDGTDTGFTQAVALIEENIAAFGPPLSIFVGIIAFIPSFFVLFISIDSNLCQHYLCTIVIPDIDKNISSSQVRSLSRTTFYRLISIDKYKHQFKSNWPYYLAYTCAYGLILYLYTFITTDNVYAMLLVIMAAPATSMFIGYFLNYFCLLNDYAFLEENQVNLLSRMPANMRNYVYQAYNNPSYVHGDESAARGCFVPENDNTFSAHQSFNQNPFGFGGMGGFGGFQNQQNPYTSYDSKLKSEEDADIKTDYNTNASETREEPTGIVIDFSETDDKKDEKDN